MSAALALPRAEPNVPPPCVSREVLASIARKTAERGARAAGEMIREKVESRCDGFGGPGSLDAFERSELIDYLNRRADELDPPRPEPRPLGTSCRESQCRRCGCLLLPTDFVPCAAENCLFREEAR